MAATETVGSLVQWMSSAVEAETSSRWLFISMYTHTNVILCIM